MGEDTSLLYHFIGEGSDFEPSKLERLISGAGVPPNTIPKIIEFMLYYGFLGVKVSDESSRFIFDVGYDMKLMKVLIAKAKDGITYILNPAFHAALNL